MKIRSKNKRFDLSLVALALLANAQAQTTWDAGGVDANINTPANWDNDTLPANDGTATVTFGTGGTTATANSNYDLAGIVFNRDANFTLAGGAASAIIIGAGGLTFSQPSATARTYTISEAVTLSANQTWQGAAFSTTNPVYSVSSAITGAFTITKSGVGTLNLSGNNSGWTGNSGLGLVLGSASTVNLSGNVPNALGTGAVRFDAVGTVTVNNGTSGTIANNFIINSTANSMGTTVGATISFGGGAGAGAVYTLSGNISRESGNTNTGSLSFLPFVSAGNGEGRINLSGDHSGLGTTNTVLLPNVGTLQIDTEQAIAPSTVGYFLNGGGANTGNRSAKLIFNVASTVNNNITFGNGAANINTNSVGTRVAAGETTTLSGTITNGSTNGGANLFAQEAGSVLDATNNLGGSGTSGAWHINRPYYYIDSAGVIASQKIPVGTVKLSRDVGTTITTDLFVWGGTLLVTNTSGGAFRGNATVNAAATLAGTGIISPNASKALSISGTVAPGDGGIGNLTLSGAATELPVATFNTGATFNFDLGAGLTADKLALIHGMDGDMVFNNNVINFNIIGAAPLALGNYTLFTAVSSVIFSGLTLDVDGNITGGLSIGTGLTGYTAALRLNGSNIVLAITSAPVATDTTPPVITLTGSATPTVNVGSTYTDEGATATDETAPVNPEVVVTGSVNTSVPGVYVLSYNAVDSAGNPAVTVTRTVTVVDAAAPVITLTGSSPVSVAWGGSYTDAGATATDNVDATVTVNVAGTVNTTKPGTYTLTYSASDTAANAATPVTRTVTVAIANPTTVGADGYSPLLKYALGATGPNGTVQDPVTSATATELSITATVRTDDANLTVTAETNTDLTNGAGWTSTGVTVTDSSDQTGVPAGTVRKVFTVSISGASKKFIRIKAVNTP
jgi:hypothetical protein